MSGAAAEERGIAADLAEGIRWLVAHPPMRTLALTIVAFNVTFGAAGRCSSSTRGAAGHGQRRVRAADDRLAIGGIVGTASYGALERRFRLANIMRVGLLIETRPTSSSP